METQSWLDDALDCGYISPEVFAQLDELWQSVGGMLANMINRADDFCKNPSDHSFLREEQETYGL